MSVTRGSMHDRRRAALQALYQFDCGRAGEPELVRAALVLQASGAPGAEPDPDSCQLAPESVEPGLALATSAWERREEADKAVSEFAAEWPTHRQPTIDRSILRLAHYEMTRGGVPHAVAIDEATGATVGVARVVTDRATFAWLCDVFVDERFRGQGLARRLLDALEREPSLQGVRRWCLATRDAHGLYAKHGYVPVPEGRWMERQGPKERWQEPQG